MTPARLAAVLLVLMAALIGLWFLAASGGSARAGEDEAARPMAGPEVGDEAAPADLLDPGEVEPEPERDAVPVEEAPEPEAPPALDPSVRREEIARILEEARRLLDRMPEDADVRGKLRSQSGIWKDVQRFMAGHVHIDMVSLDERRLNYRANLASKTEPSGEEVIEFLFHDVAPGTYELTLSSTDHHRWSPKKITVTPPADDLEIWLYDERDTITLAFRVTDAQTGEPIEDYTAYSVKTEVTEENGVLFHAGPVKLDDFPLDARIRWRLWADGYAPASGDERDFLEEEDGRWVAEVKLEPGWGRRFVVLGRNPTMRPLEGAQVLLDGDVAGKTDANGALDVFRETAPESLDVIWADWKVLDPTVQSPTVAAFKGQITVLRMVPPE